MTIESKLALANKRKHDRIKQIQIYFTFEKEQVEILLMLMWHYKRSYPIGISYQDLLSLLTEQGKYVFYKDKTYIRHLLNTLTMLKLLELRPADKSYDITSFGLEYYIECQKN